MVILLSRVSKFQIFVVFFFFFWLLLLLFVSFSTLTMSCHSFLVFIVSAEKSTVSLMGISFVALCFSLSAFRKLFLSLTFAVLIIICLDVLFGFILFGILCASCTWISDSLFRFRKFSVIISSNTFSIPSFLFSFRDLWSECWNV